MSLDDKYPRIKDVLDGNVDYPSTAFDNDAGMRVMPDPGPVVDGDMIQDAATGLFLPAPTQKPITRLFFEGGAFFDVSESYDVVVHDIDIARARYHEDAENGRMAHDAWYGVVFTGPIYKTPVRIEEYALRHLLCIVTEFIDLSKVELAQKQAELNARTMEAQMNQQRLQLLNTTRENERRSRR